MESIMHLQSDNIEIVINDEADDIVERPFDSHKNRYQNNLKLINNIEFVFNYVHLLYYKGYEINTNCGGLYIDSPDWIKTKEQQ